MSSRRQFVRLAAGAASAAAARVSPASGASGADDRAYWVEVLRRLAAPLLTRLAKRRLKADMPVELSPSGSDAQRRYTHLEAFGRLLAGIAPWLEVSLAPSPERELRDELAGLARQGLAAATDLRSPDFMNFTEGRQPVVDAAFLAYGILRAPRALWRELDATTRSNVVAALRSTRVIRTSFNNHLLFSAMVEAWLCMAGEDWDPMRVDYAVRAHELWYKGDGVYGDGPEFHWDYYNSFVIQPMLLDVLETALAREPASDRTRQWSEMLKPVRARAARYAAILERLISPEGTYPPIGRSLAYRFGAFQLLGQMALRHELPSGTTPAQVRCALTAVIRRSIEAAGTFDSEGWLRIGLAGHQPGLGEGYISTGSLYLCSTGLLPLGLPPTDPFWSSAPADWTARRLWRGENLPADAALPSEKR